MSIDPFLNLEKCLSRIALSEISLDRDETDTYALKIRNITLDGDPFPERRTAMELLPAGSRWTQALGWHSYVGIPFPSRQPKWLAIGVEKIVVHPTRGAYPVFRAYVFDFPPDGTLIDALRNLRNGLPPTNTTREPECFNGLIRSSSASIAEHVWIEKYIIDRAISFYGERHPLLFRTVILSEAQLTNKAYPQPALGNNNPPTCLVATVPSIERTFSWWMREVHLRLVASIDWRSGDR